MLYRGGTLLLQAHKLCSMGYKTLAKAPMNSRKIINVVTFVGHWPLAVGRTLVGGEVFIPYRVGCVSALWKCFACKAAVRDESRHNSRFTDTATPSREASGVHITRKSIARVLVELRTIFCRQIFELLPLP